MGLGRELRGSLINDIAALNKVEFSGWYWCDRLQAKPLDQPHDGLDKSLDVLAASRRGDRRDQEVLRPVSGVEAAADAVAR